MRKIGMAAVLTLAAGAQGQLWLVESFENGSNGAGWTFGSPGEFVQPSGGYSSGAYVRAPALHTMIPWFGTSPGTATPFTGNYRAAGVTRIAAALMVLQSDLPVGTQRPAVLLVSFNGTPTDPSDDWGAFSVTQTLLGTTGTWTMHNFSIPSVQTTLPASWSIIRLGANAPASPSWNTLVQGVDRLVFTYGDPSAVYPEQNWDVGADYILITDRPGCYANCDYSTGAPFLNVLDFMCFLNRFAAGDPRANCDQSTTPPVLNVLDFSCFLMMFAAGCSSP